MNNHIFTGVVPSKVENTRAVNYRLLEKLDGTLVLQGFFSWQEGWEKFGGDWKDTPTVKETLPLLKETP